MSVQAGLQSFAVMVNHVHVSLEDFLSAKKLSVREAAEMTATIAEAMGYAHSLGVIHRDLKPSNILLDEWLTPYILDFGLAKRDTGEITVTLDGAILGTPLYMSPEQARGEAHSADARTDIYSLGVILFRLLTGELPFRGNRPMLLHQIVHDDPPMLRSLNSAIPRDMETICMKCLQKDRQKRYAKAAGSREFLVRSCGLARWTFFGIRRSRTQCATLGSGIALGQYNDPGT